MPLAKLEGDHLFHHLYTLRFDSVECLPFNKRNERSLKSEFKPRKNEFKPEQNLKLFILKILYISVNLKINLKIFFDKTYFDQSGEKSNFFILQGTLDNKTHQ